MSQPQDAARSASWAKLLGYTGWLPAGALLALALSQPDWINLATRIATIYVATIFCFLGGIQWGFAMHGRRPDIALRRYFVGVLPSLWALGSLLLPARLSIVGLIVGLALLLTYEMMERGDDVYPEWYIGLRARLTIGLVLAIGAFTLLPSA